MLSHPSEEEFLYFEKDLHHPSFRQSYVSPRMFSKEEAHQRAYPLFAHAKGMQCFLNPGDMLFIPHRWGHYIETQPAVDVPEPMWITVNRLIMIMPKEKQRARPSLAIDCTSWPSH